MYRRANQAPRAEGDNLPMLNPPPTVLHRTTLPPEVKNSIYRYFFMVKAFLCMVEAGFIDLPIGVDP